MNNYDINHPLQRNGTSQKDRVKPALDPSSIRVDERGMAELIAYAHRYAAVLNYFKLDNTVDGDWQFFFEVDDTTLLAIIAQLPDDYVASIAQLQSDLEYWASQLAKDNIVRKNIEARLIKDFPAPNIEAANKVFLRVRQDANKYFETALQRDDHKPHIALFLAFLFLYEKAQNHLNEFTARHLEFFLEKVLRLERKAAMPDSVHLIFELAETVKEHRIAKKTEFKGGKDDLGKKRFYLLLEELIATKASIAELKTIFIDKENKDQLRAAPIANSLDGMGTEFEDEMTGWPSFGDTIAGAIGEPGIAIASPILYMQEGNRLTTLTFNLQIGLLPANLQNAFRVFLTTPEGWLELAETTDATTTAVNTGFTPAVEGNKIKIYMKLHFGDPAIDVFDPEIFEDGFNSHFPTVKILLNSAATNYAYQSLKNVKINNVEIHVDCKGISTLIIQNDLAQFQPGKAFQPFGNSPKIGANLYLGSGEVFNKTLTKLDIHVDWEGLPRNFASYYDAYPAGINENSFKAKIYMLEKKNWTTLGTRNLFEIANNPPPYATDQTWTQEYEDSPISIPLVSNDTEGNLSSTTVIADGPTNGTNLQQNLNVDPPVAVDDNASFFEDTPVTVFIPYSGDYLLANSTKISVDSALLDNIPRVTDLPISLKRLDSKTLSGFLRLQLNGKDFQHSTYPVLYAQAMIQEAKKVFDGGPNPVQAIPNLPYTPTIRNIYLDYESKVNISFSNTQAAFKNRVERLFYVNPFGWEEAHPYLLGPGNSNLRFFPSNVDTSGQTFEGQLFFGIDKLEPQSVLSMLFQVLEGSGDPDAQIPTIDWSYLVDNKWVPFNDSMILSDTTNTLLQSGIIQIQIPKKIKSGSSILNGNLTWLRAAVSRPAGISPLDPKYRTIAFPKILSVQAQAGLAIFDDRGNDLSHLATSLPVGTISKMVVRDTNVKTVTQPFASFGGRLEEDDDAFYRRTSEHLRHKGRAITIWDYEHMILEEFPAIYKVKCLSHYNSKNANAPGHVTLGIIPDLSNQNAVDPYRPRVDVNTRSQIKAFLQTKVSPFIICNLHVVNPRYERVKVILKVAFKKGYDSHGFYKKELNEAIKNYLAPWASNSNAVIAFGGLMYKSEILYFIENLEYVDYITDFRVDHFWIDVNDNSPKVESNVTTIQTKTPLSILTTYITSVANMLDHSIEVLATTGDQAIICEEKNC